MWPSRKRHIPVIPFIRSRADASQRQLEKPTPEGFTALSTREVDNCVERNSREDNDAQTGAITSLYNWESLRYVSPTHVFRQMRSALVLVILALGVRYIWSPSHVLAQAPTTQDPNKPRRIRLGGDVHPVVKHRVEPKYPKEAIEHGLEGDVQAMVLFGTDGLVKNVKILSGDPSLAESVSTALSDWRYAPLQLNGKPVEVEAPITVTFRLKPKPSVSDNEHPAKGGETVPRQ